ncbi:MAG: AAA family ATPase, partial [Nitrososphaerota archaeon]|nr:AAA family ATPase [Nitrososphaerota archaeon]
MSEHDFMVVIAEWMTNGPPAVMERDVSLTTDPKTVVSVVGPRRAGKTSLLFRTMARLLSKGVPKQNILYVDFEHPALVNVA